MLVGTKQWHLCAVISQIMFEAKSLVGLFLVLADGLKINL